MPSPKQNTKVKKVKKAMAVNQTAENKIKTEAGLTEALAYITNPAKISEVSRINCSGSNSNTLDQFRLLRLAFNQNSSGVVHCYEIALKGATTQKVSLGEDANGNITRIDNAIGRLSEHIENTKVELKNIQTQYETAQIEVQKPFAQEEELKAKTKRQIEVEKLISSGATDEQKQEDIPDCYYFPATDEQINALTNASVSFEKQTKSDGSIIIRVGIDDKEKAETIMNAKKVVL